MIDIARLRTNPTLVKEQLANRRRDPGIVDQVLTLDAEHRATTTALNDLRADRNQRSQSKPSPEERELLKALSIRIKELEHIEREQGDAFARAIRSIPNILAPDVPVGMDETANVVLREVGTRPSFSFPIQDHLALGQSLGILDVERAATVSGARFTYLLGDGARLQLALLQYVLDTVSKHGFTLVFPPHIISTESMAAMGYLEHGGEEEIYHLRNDEMVLIGTSEQAIGPMHKNETLDPTRLPLRYVGYSPCYRREAGSYGKDVRGILRVHQFDKVELFSFTLPEQSDAEHELLLQLQEELMQGLGLAYRVVKLCSGDVGMPSSRTYDIETWIPSQQVYRETHSTSNTTDYQTRRLGTRTIVNGAPVLVHALNGTAFAMGRIIIAILEQGQTEDGSVRIPECLQAFLGGQKVIKPRS